jgi:hypothetical protein
MVLPSLSRPERMWIAAVSVYGRVRRGGDGIGKRTETDRVALLGEFGSGNLAHEGAALRRDIHVLLGKGRRPDC